MAKPTRTRDVFDRLDEPEESVIPDTATDSAEDTEAADDTAAVTAAGVEDAPGDDTHGDSSPRRLPRRAAAVLVGVVVAASVGTAVFLGWRLMQIENTASAGRAALAAAKQYALTLTTLDTNDIDENYQRALDGATGQFKEDYSQGSAHLRQILIDSKAQGKGVVVDGAVKSATKTEVEVLLFVDQSVSNAVLREPRIDRNRVQMTMQLVDNRWLASKVDII